MHIETLDSSEGLDRTVEWSSVTRICVTPALLAYLFLVMIGPLSNPIASQNLAAPIARAVTPVHQATFLGHGYRFFGPNPGESHIVVYKIKRSDGEVIEGRFPDRKSNRPRLMYHRWFMLSETIYQEYIKLYLVAIEDVEAEFSEAELALKAAGQPVVARRLAVERIVARRQFEISKARFEQLVGSVAEFLRLEHDGQSIELFILERAIAPPLDVVGGIKLDDPGYLTEPTRVWPIPELPQPARDNEAPPPLVEIPLTGGD